MGVSSSVNTNSNNFSTAITQSLKQSVNASATANCNVNIGSISFTSNNGCSVTVSNMCSATSTGVLDAVLDGIFQAYDQLDASNKQEAAQLFSATFAVNTNITNIKKDFSTYVEQQCGATSNLNQNISIQNISLGACTSSSPNGLQLNFVNSGKADANCAMGILQKLIVQASNQVATNNDNTNSYGAIILGLVAIAGIFALLVYAWYAKRILFATVDDQIRLQWAKKEIIPWALQMEMFNKI